MSGHPPLSPMPAVRAGEYYSSGSYHGAWDLPVPIGTPVHAVRSGGIFMCADGVANDTPGDRDYAGEPSNWILQWVMFRGNPYSVYYQHLSPGLKVRNGQRVEAGQVIARSGDSGNSSGPHLHIHVMKGHQANRYQLYINQAVAVYPPSLVWSDHQQEDTLMATKEQRQELINELLAEKIYGQDADKEDKDVTVRQALREAHQVHKWMAKERQR